MKNIRLSTFALPFHNRIDAITKEHIEMCSFDIIKRPCVIAGVHHKGKAAIHGAYGETEFPLSVMGEHYTAFTNQELIKLLQDEFDFPIAALSTWNDGKRFSIMMKVGEIKVNGKDEGVYAMIENSHDGDCSVKLSFFFFRFICMNGMISKGNEQIIRVRHTKNARDTMEVRKELFFSTMEKEVNLYKARREKLASVKVKDADIDAIALALVCGKGKEKVSGQARNTASEIARLARSGAGNKGETLDDILNGISDHYSSGDGVGKRENRDSYKAANSYLFGGAAKNKTNLFNAIHKGADNVTELVSEGRRLLALAA